MRLTMYPKKLYCLLAFASLGALLALLSRKAPHLTVRNAFKIVGGGDASLIEHLLSGIAVPALFVGCIILLACIPTKKKFVKSRFRNLTFVGMRRWIMIRCRPTYVTHWTSLIALTYVTLSFYWEMNQASVRGFFQIDQFAMDITGALLICLSMWVMLQKNRQVARRTRVRSLA